MNRTKARGKQGLSPIGSLGGQERDVQREFVSQKLQRLPARAVLYAVPNQSIRGGNEKYALARDGMMSGVSDMEVHLDSLSHWLEFKKPGEMYARQKQIEFAQLLMKNGRRWSLVDDPNDAYEELAVAGFKVIGFGRVVSDLQPTLTPQKGVLVLDVAKLLGGMGGLRSSELWTDRRPPRVKPVRRAIFAALQGVVNDVRLLGQMAGYHRSIVIEEIRKAKAKPDSAFAEFEDFAVAAFSAADIKAGSR